MGNVYLDGKNGFAIDEDRLADFTVCPRISAEVALDATGTTNLIEVPPGTLITKVALWNNSDTALGGAADVDVGLSGDTDKFIDGLAELVANDITISSTGAYTANGDTVSITVNTAAAAGSTGKVLVWYTHP